MITAVRLSAPGETARLSAVLDLDPPRPGQPTATGRRLWLVWLGQRTIPGIDPGRWLRVEGHGTETDGRTTVFNPRYDLLTGAARD